MAEFELQTNYYATTTTTTHLTFNMIYKFL